MRVAIVGGGVTGLSCAFCLEQSGVTDIVLFEATDRLGGKVETLYLGGLTVEVGADAVFTRKPFVLNLIRQLGLEDELIEPSTSQFSILLDGSLQIVPHGLLRFGAISSEALDQVGFLSAEAKERVLEEETITPGTQDDESIASFFRRRYGREYSEKVAETLLAGTHGGSPERLSMKALYPSYLEMERNYGSLTAAVRALGPPSGGPAFVSFKRGLQTLVDGLRRNLVSTHVSHQKITELDSSGSAVRIDGQEFDHVVLAIPASSAALLLGQDVTLKALPTASSAIATFGYSSKLNLIGSGFLVPYTEPSKITGATWTSNKWSDRTPDGSSLLRVFLGRPGGLSVDEESDETLLAIAKESLAKIMGYTPEPNYVKLQRWSNALPLYELGHAEKIDEIESRLPRGIHLAGTSYRGVGIPDCIGQGLKVAAKIVMSDALGCLQSILS